MLQPNSQPANQPTNVKSQDQNKTTTAKKFRWFFFFLIFFDTENFFIIIIIILIINIIITKKNIYKTNTKLQMTKTTMKKSPGINLAKDEKKEEETKNSKINSSSASFIDPPSSSSSESAFIYFFVLCINWKKTTTTANYCKQYLQKYQKKRQIGTNQNTLSLSFIHEFSNQKKKKVNNIFIVVLLHVCLFVCNQQV